MVLFCGRQCIYDEMFLGLIELLADEYFFKALPVVQKRRIAQGGVRLGAILNRIFSGNSFFFKLCLIH
jgi:hypothetical protein